MNPIKSNADTCAPSSAQRAVYSLVEIGLVERIDPGGVGNKATFALTDSGLKYAQDSGYLEGEKQKPVINPQITGNEKVMKNNL